MFENCTTVSDAIKYALDRSMAVEIQPGWRTFDVRREGVFVRLLDREGDIIAKVYVPVP